MSFVAVFSDVSEIDNPFLWKPQENLESVPEDMIGRLSLKIEEKSLEEEIEFESIILYLTLSYEHFNAGNASKSREILRDMVEESSRLAKLDDSGSSHGRLLALRHLLLSAQTHVSIYSKDIEQARKEFNEIPRISSMDTRSKAALNGFRASFYAEYGTCGSKAAIVFAEKAVEMDPQESLWYFIKAKMLGRVRRVESPFDIPSPDELEALEIASEKESNAAYVLFTAETYRETAQRAFKKHSEDRTLYPNLKQMIDKMNAKSSELYEKSLLLKPYCSHLKFRCAKGFMKLPPPYKNTDLAKKCILEGLKMAPTSAYGNHVMAMYYERYDKNIHSSISHLKICVPMRVFGAEIDLLRLEYSHSGLSNDDLLRRLDKLYEDYPQVARRCQILSQFISFYLFIDYVIEKAIEYLIEVFRLNISCDDIHKHRSLFLRIRYTISLLDIVVDETKIWLNDRNCSPRTRDVCRKFLADLADLNVAYARNKPRYLRQACLRNSISSNQARGGRGGRGGRAGAKSGGRGQSSTNATMSYVRRREQQATVDEALKKIDNLTNTWKEDLERRSTADSDGARSNAWRRTDKDGVDGRSDDDDDEGICSGGHSSTNSSSSVRCLPQGNRFQPPSAKAGSRQADSSLKGFEDQGHSFAALAISPGPNEEGDFEDSVLAYRRAKRAGHAARALDDEPSESGLSHSDDRTARASRNANASSQNGSGRPSRPKPKKANGDHFDNYLARSTAQIEKKFEPAEIRF